MDINVTLSGLEVLADAINNLANALKAGVKAEQAIETAKVSSRKPKPEAPPPAEPTPVVVEPASTEAAPPTVTEVRAAIAAFSQKDKNAAIALLQKYGAASVSALKAEHYAAVLAEASK